MIAASDIERARALRIEDEIARRSIKLKRVGAELIGACPACGGRDRFGVNTRKQKWNCRGHGGGNDAIGLVQHLDGCDLRTAITTLIGNIVRREATPAPAHGNDDKDERYKLDQADEIWRETSPLVPDAIAYFANRRKIDITAVPDQGGLRFHPRCPWGNGRTPAIIGRFTTAVSNTPRGIWRRPITGEKPKTLGPIKGCVIRLSGHGLSRSAHSLTANLSDRLVNTAVENGSGGWPPLCGRVVLEIVHQDDALAVLFELAHHRFNHLFGLVQLEVTRESMSGPPVVSISTMRAKPIPPGLSHAGIAVAEGAGWGCGAGRRRNGSGR